TWPAYEDRRLQAPGCELGGAAAPAATQFPSSRRCSRSRRGPSGFTSFPVPHWKKIWSTNPQ
ncbi:MAG TPA: hypothetical protein VHM65_01675, partial [Candidatus Lustribacter sp.]|nr:hypothetical protein [Candidatus Lustribacter sp.]